METKKCQRCGRTLPTTQFYRYYKNPDGLQAYCKDCARQAKRRWSDNLYKDPAIHAASLRKTKERAMQRAAANPVTEKRCSRCGRTLPVEQFHINNFSSDGRTCYCKDCTTAYIKHYNATIRYNKQQNQKEK